MELHRLFSFDSISSGNRTPACSASARERPMVIVVIRCASTFILCLIIVERGLNVTLFYDEQPVQRGRQRADGGPGPAVAHGGRPPDRRCRAMQTWSVSSFDAELAAQIAKRLEARGPAARRMPSTPPESSGFGLFLPLPASPAAGFFCFGAAFLAGFFFFFGFCGRSCRRNSQIFAASRTPPSP